MTKKKKLVIDPLNQHSVLESFTLNDFKPIYFSFRYLPQAPMLLQFLNVRPGDNDWISIGQNLTDTDGEIRVFLGNYPPGTPLIVSFGVRAIANVQRSAVFIGQVNPQNIIKFPPGN
ncbi:MAG TPA: hypothetical protein VJU78_17185, partial [Chitinophagaceae bacterium]|nr:hypothetical protein [Chitinophagaceae bacterium]